MTFTSAEALNDVAERLRASERLILLLDYDGTLVPFADVPNQAAPDGPLLQLLASLSQRKGTAVHLVSGRDRETLQNWLGGMPVALYAEHGFWSREPGAEGWTPLFDIPEDWKAAIKPVLRDFAQRTPGAFVEEKSVSMAWHYRMVDATLAAQRLPEIYAALAASLSGIAAQVLAGDHVVEVRWPDANKGVVVRRVTRERGETCSVVAMGDDTTDEDMFAALPQEAIAIHVGPSASQASFRLRGPDDVRRFLTKLLERSG